MSERTTDADTDPTPDDIELSDAEREALHDMQLGAEYVHRAYGNLLAFHHQVGRAMNLLSDAEDRLREAGHEDWADELRDEHLPAGAIGDRWTFELVDEFSTAFLDEIDGFESAVRDDLAEGVHHVSEREEKRRTRERAEDG